MKPIRVQNNDENYDDFSLDQKLRSLSSEDLYDLIHNLMINDLEVHRLILEWLKENSKEMGCDNEIIFLNDGLLIEYWENARIIISKFNEYGGGPDEDEEVCYDWLDKISKLIAEGNISTDVKLDFLDEAFEEYNNENSGFEDALKDIFFNICQTEGEWNYLVRKLEEHPSRWRKELIIDIQRKYLHNDNAYITERLENLVYGRDYWDLAKFYLEKRDNPKAIEMAERGILEGKGWLTDLFNFLSDHYIKEADTVNLERIARTALLRNTEEKNMLYKLFKYYGAQGNYEMAKENLLKSQEFVGKGEYYTEYNRMKGFLRDSDWKVIEPDILKKTQENDIMGYLEICLDKDMKKTVLDTILDWPVERRGYGTAIDFDGFADRLKEDFPEEIIEYYWKKARSNIPGGTRDTYRIAAAYLAETKSIYIGLLNDRPAWKRCFSDLKEEFKNRPAFLEEVNHL
jgi:uncharacterized Zn finger protein